MGSSSLFRCISDTSVSRTLNMLSAKGSVRAFKTDVYYTYDGNSTTGNIRLYRPKRNAIEDYTLTEPGIVYDMLSIFYVIRTFDFRAMEMYQIYNTKIFSGKNLEYLEIEYLGQEILKQNKKEYSTYKLRFRFYDRTGKKTSDKISAWISTDNKAY